MNKSKGELSLHIKLGYGLGQFSEGIAYNFFYYFYTYFLVSMVGLSPGHAGTLSAFAVIWDAVTDPLIGYLSDQCKSQRGRRRVFIGKAAIPLGIVVALICYVPPVDGIALNLYLIIVNILFWLLFTTCDIPWITLGNEITDDFDEKSSIRSISTSFLFLGQLVASGLSLPLVSFFCNFVATELAAWQILGVVLGGLTTMGFAVSYFTTKGLDKPAQTKNKSGFPVFKMFERSLKVKGFGSLMLVSIFATAATGVFLSGEVFYLSIIFNMSEIRIASVNIVIAIFSFLFAFVVGWLANKFDKKKVLAGHFLIGGAGLLILWQLPANTFSLVSTLVVFYLADVAFWAVIFSVLGDVTELESYRSEEDATGFISSFLSLGIKVGTAAGMWLLGVGLEFIGYGHGVSITPEMKSDFSDIFYLSISLFYFVAFICIVVYPYSRGKYYEEKNRIKNRA